MDIYYDRTKVKSVDSAVCRYHCGELQSPARSTVPLLSWIKYKEAMVQDIIAELGMSRHSSLHMEYTVKSGAGRGRASHTDLMVASAGAALAIEAKWTEPRYDTVREWLEVPLKKKNRKDIKKPPNNRNRKKVLSGWLKLIGNYLGTAPDPPDFDQAVYQMVHRAASACAAGGDKAAMAYLLFEPSIQSNTATQDEVAEDLRHLWTKLGQPRSLPFYLVTVKLKYRPAYEAIRCLNRREERSDCLVRAALVQGEPLFDFDDYRLIKVANL